MAILLFNVTEETLADSYLDFISATKWLTGRYASVNGPFQPARKLLQITPSKSRPMCGHFNPLLLLPRIKAPRTGFLSLSSCDCVTHCRDLYFH